MMDAGWEMMREGIRVHRGTCSLLPSRFLPPKRVNPPEPGEL